MNRKSNQEDACGTPCRVVIFDLCPLFRDALADVATSIDGFDVILATSDPRLVMNAVSQEGAGMAVFDLDAGSAALDLLQKTRAHHEDCRCVVTITDGSQPELMAAIRLQADGFLSKRLTAEEFREQLLLVSQGDMAISASLTSALAVTLRSSSQHESRDIASLSPRELDVLKCIASGMSNRLISEKLSISDGTVKVHVKHVLKKLHFGTRVEAALWAKDNGQPGQAAE